MSQNPENSSILLAKRPTSALIIIGNEILSGVTVDKNINYIAVRLREYGIDLSEVRVIPDIEDSIVETVNQLRGRYDYIFTTGGIGPTHDDITASSIAKAFNQDLVQNEIAYQSLKKFYAERGEELNYGRLRMAMMPSGATIIKNEISSAPGFHVENVYILAGIPRIMQVMFEEALKTLPHGTPVQSVAIKAEIIEGDIAEKLAKLQDKHPEVEIGSYPSKEGSKFIVTIIICGDDSDLLHDLQVRVGELIISSGGRLADE